MMPSHPDRVRRNQPEVNEPHPWIALIKQHGPALVAASADLLSRPVMGGYPIMLTMPMPMPTPIAYGWREQDGTRVDVVVTPAPDRRACPRCAGPSLSGGICLSCLRGPDEPSSDTPWGV